MSKGSPASIRVAAIISAFDWAATPLGPIDTWPASLRHIVDFMLASPGLASVAVGPQRILIYNDMAATHYGANHPRALGHPLAETFDEYPKVAGFYDRAFAGESVHVPAQPLDPSDEHRDEVYEAFLTPIRDEADTVVAVHMSGIARGGQARAEAALRESEARHWLLIGSVAQAVWETDPAGVVVADSPSWRAYTGQALDDWFGYGWLDAIHPDDRAYAERQWREAVASRRLVDAEFRLRAPDGGWRWTNVRAAPVPDAQGNIVKWAGMNIDIDARKHAEAALRESEEKYRSLFENMGQGYSLNQIVRDAGGRAVDLRYLELNPAFERLTGASLSEARGRLASEVFPGLDRYWIDICDRAITGGVIERVEHELTPNGRWYQSNFYPIGGDRVLSLYDDITPRKRAETALRESEERQEFLLEFSDALRAEPDADAVANRALHMVLEKMRLDRCYITYYRPDDDEADFPYQLGDDAVPPLPAKVRLSDFPDAYEQVREKTFVIDDDYERRGLSEAERANSKALGMRAMVASTVRHGSNRPLASLAAISSQPRRWSTADVALVEEVAERTWAAVERARAENALRESEEKYRTIFDSIDDGLAVVEMIYDDGGEIVDMIFRQVNDAYERQGGISNVVGRSVREMLPGVEDIWLDRYKQVATTGEPIHVEDYQKDVDRWFEVYFARVDDRGRFVAIVFNDISERKRAELLLRDSEERQTFLLKLSDALRTEPDAGAITARAVQLLADELQLDRCYVVANRPGEDLWDVVAEVRLPGLPAMHPVLDQRDFPQALQLITEQTLVIDDTATHPGFMDAEKASLQALGFGALLMAVLRKGERKPAWALVASFARPHSWTSSEVALVEEMAERTWSAIERARAETALRESEQRQQVLIEGVPQLVWRAVGAGHWTWASPQWTEQTGQAEADSHGFGWLDAVHPEDRQQVCDVWAEAAERGEFHADYRIGHAAEGRYRWFHTRATPVRSGDGSIVEWLGTSTDVDDLRGLQERQQVLLAELQHRVRNILAVIRSIMRRSLDGQQSLQDYAQHLEGRMDALARTQVLLTRQANARANLEDLLRDELVAQAVDEDRIKLGGPEVALSPRAAEVLGLAVHELATNALKYGAIGKPSGSLTIDWSVEECDGEQWLAFRWIERGVPVSAGLPQRSGFGTELITRRVPYELKGKGELEMMFGGVACTITFPLRDGSSVLETGGAVSLNGVSE